MHQQVGGGGIGTGPGRREPRCSLESQHLDDLVERPAGLLAGQAHVRAVEVPTARQHGEHELRHAYLEGHDQVRSYVVHAPFVTQALRRLLFGGES